MWAYKTAKNNSKCSCSTILYDFSRKLEKTPGSTFFGANTWQSIYATVGKFFWKQSSSTRTGMSKLTIFLGTWPTVQRRASTSLWDSATQRNRGLEIHNVRQDFPLYHWVQIGKLCNKLLWGTSTSAYQRGTIHAWICP